MIELVGFKGYFLDIQNFGIFSGHTKDFLKPKYEGKKKTFVLYKNGVPHTVSLFQILRKNVDSLMKQLR